jgi:hypothetical protein
VSTSTNGVTWTSQPAPALKGHFVSSDAAGLAEDGRVIVGGCTIKPAVELAVWIGTPSG